LAILAQPKHAGSMSKEMDDGEDEPDMPSDMDQAKEDGESAAEDLMRALKLGDKEAVYQAFCDLCDAHADHSDAMDSSDQSDDDKSDDKDGAGY
jgi:hypothetical protein